eukprot:7233497-Pyramimonas_sp.AAC.2
MVGEVGGSRRNHVPGAIWGIRFTEMSWGPAVGFPGGLLGSWGPIMASRGPLGSLTGLLGSLLMASGG